MTEPTDAELGKLAEECGIGWGAGLGGMSDFLSAFARAVLDKWGQPAHSGEPVGYLYCGGIYGDELADWEIVAEQFQCDKLNEHHGAIGKEAKLPLYTVPQPSPTAQGDIPDVDVPDQCPYFGPSPHRDVWLAGWYAARAARAPADSVTAPAGGADWQDISTAPKDGTRFVAVGQNYGLDSEAQHTCIAQWLAGCWVEVSDWNGASKLKYLTHWMPLPPLPCSAGRAWLEGKP